MDIKKSSGLIFHPTSLPSKYGIGDFGKDSYEFIDLLSSTGTKVWQVLPLGITDNVEYSPYSSKSSILGNPYIVSLENLENGLFKKEDLTKVNVLRRIISPMGTMDGIEFLMSKLKNTKNNADFFVSMNKPS